MGFARPRIGLIAGMLGSILALGAASSMPAAPVIEVGSGYTNPSAPAKALHMNTGLQAIVEEAAMRNMLFGRQSSGWLKHRAPGERAHRRWRHARASGIKGAYRG